MRTGWECPKCGSVWGPLVSECRKCNESPKRQPYLKREPYREIWEHEGEPPKSTFQKETPCVDSRP